jgi:hypothetical protein
LINVQYTTIRAYLNTRIFFRKYFGSGIQYTPIEVYSTSAFTKKKFHFDRKGGTVEITTKQYIKTSKGNYATHVIAAFSRVFSLSRTKETRIIILHTSTRSKKIK